MTLPPDIGLIPILAARLAAATEDVALLESQSEAHRRAFSEQVAQISEKYMTVNGRLSPDAVELFAVHRKLVIELLNDSMRLGNAMGRQKELTEIMKHLALGG